MKKYTILPILKDSAWNRRSFLKYVPIWLKVFCQGIRNIIRWMPTIYKDKDWDSTFIYTILQKKIEHQRKYLVKENRHTRIYHDNFWMTVCLNLLEKVKTDYYYMEYLDEKYVKFGTGLLDKNRWENFQEYLDRYPKDRQKASVKYKFPLNDILQVQAMLTSQYRQERAKDLLFKILAEKMEYWWD